MENITTTRTSTDKLVYENRDGLLLLPTDLAEQTVRRFFSWYRFNYIIIEYQGATGKIGSQDYTVSETEWCLGVEKSCWFQFSLILTVDKEINITVNEKTYWAAVFPKYAIKINSRYKRNIRSALETVKDALLKPGEIPPSWVRREKIVTKDENYFDNEKDVEIVSDLPEEKLSIELGEVKEHPLVENIEQKDDFIIPDPEIRSNFESFRQKLGLPPFTLIIRRSPKNQKGFVAGRIRLTRFGIPRLMTITVCPNADLAEIQATLIHEFAHPLSIEKNGKFRHNRHFKAKMVELAGILFAKKYFAPPKKLLLLNNGNCKCCLIDNWIASGIRAFLSSRESVAEEKMVDAGETARLLKRLHCLRTMAASEPGTAEAITATAIANDIITVYGLDNYILLKDADIANLKHDLWIKLELRKAWKYALAHQVAHFCGVFSLSRKKSGLMHFFGKHQDLVFAEYLFQVCDASIERACETHIKTWRASYRPQRGETVTKKDAFYKSAVWGLADQMKEILKKERKNNPKIYAQFESDMRKAENFAREEHHIRGMRWGSGGRTTVRHCEQGYNTGKNIALHRGVNSGGKRVKGFLK